MDRKSESDNNNIKNITQEWVKSTEPKGYITEKLEYTVNGISYSVDGKQVILHPTPQEMAVASLLSKKYRKKVEIVPQILYPQGIQTPDYLINSERFDLKSPIEAARTYYMMPSQKSENNHPILSSI